MLRRAWTAFRRWLLEAPQPCVAQPDGSVPIPFGGAFVVEDKMIRDVTLPFEPIDGSLFVIRNGMMLSEWHDYDLFYDPETDRAHVHFFAGSEPRTEDLVAYHGLRKAKPQRL